jgi:hypothetical protein
VSPKPAVATLREIRRGEAPDEIVLVAEDGRAIILRAHGIHDDERRRVRESAMWLLIGLVEPEPRPAVDTKRLAAVVNSRRLGPTEARPR